VKHNGLDVSIVFGKNPTHISNIKNKGVLFESSPSDFLLNVSDIGSFRVQDGRSITIQPNPRANNLDISLLLISSVFPAIVHQLGKLPFHGSCIDSSNGSIIICGDSSSGKSSIAASFALQNCHILSDDMSVIDCKLSNNPIVYSGVPYLKLWKDVITYLRISQPLDRVRSNVNKYYYPLSNFDPKYSNRLSYIICLERTNYNQLKIRLVDGIDKFKALTKYIHRKAYTSSNDAYKNQFKILSSIANHVPVYIIERPESPLDIYRVKDLIESTVFQ
jgi:hypothetical protein